MKMFAAARLCNFERIHAVFQPHRYTRTQHLIDEFAKSFHQADVVYVLDIYAASERPIEGVTSTALVERMRYLGHRCVEYTGPSNAVPTLWFRTRITLTSANVSVTSSQNTVTLGDTVNNHKPRG